MENIEIVVKGHLNRAWAEWFEVTSVVLDPEGSTSVKGIIRDQAELFGILNHLKKLGINILKIEKIEMNKSEDHYEK